MMNKANHSSIKYYINEEKRTVVAVLEHGREEAEAYMSAPVVKFTHSQMSCASKWGWIDDEYIPISQAAHDIMKPRYTGVAKCADQDEFDVEVGKNLARARCLAAYYNDLWEAFCQAECNYDELIAVMNRKKQKAIDSYRHWLNKCEYKDSPQDAFTYAYLMRESLTDCMPDDFMEE